MKASGRTRARVGALITSATLGLGALVATSPADASIAAPSGLKAAQVASKGVALTWSKTGEDAYRVRIATDSAMTSGVDRWDVRGNYFEWTHTDPNPSISSPRLTPGKTYYFEVKAITDEPISSDRVNLSTYSKAVAVTLPKTGASELKPVNLTTTTGGANTISISWRTRGPGVLYKLRYTQDASLGVTSWRSVTLDAAGGMVTGLAPSTKYYFRARVMNAAGDGISDYSSAAVTATTPATTPSPGLSVVSYNVLKATSGTNWAGRRGPVAENIKARQPDVLGLQEATPLTDGTEGGVKQYDDIVNLLGNEKFSLVTRAGSSGTKIVYNTERLSVVDTGVKMLYVYGAAERYAVWAILEDKLSSKTFFVINTHLEPGSQTDSTNNSVRIRQAGEVVDLISAHAGGRPVVILGDMNSSRAAKPYNGQYAVFTGAGFVDPLDNATANWASGANATAEHIFDAQYNSYNGMEKEARLTSYPIGTNIDYVYVSPSIRVAEWRTMVKLDTTGSFVGTIPSDHNLLHVSLHLP